MLLMILFDFQLGTLEVIRPSLWRVKRLVMQQYVCFSFDDLPGVSLLRCQVFILSILCVSRSLSCSPLAASLYVYPRLCIPLVSYTDIGSPERCIPLVTRQAFSVISASTGTSPQ